MLDVTCLCTRTRRAARALSDVYDAALAPAGLRVTQFSLLRAVARLGEPTLSGLAQATGLDRSTLGRNVRVLDRMGLVRIGPGRDERTRLVALTPAGAEAVDAAAPLWNDVQTRIAARFAPEERAALDSALDRLATLEPGRDEDRHDDRDGTETAR